MGVGKDTTGQNGEQEGEEEEEEEREEASLEK